MGQQSGKLRFTVKLSSNLQFAMQERHPDFTKFLKFTTHILVSTIFGHLANKENEMEITSIYRQF